ncbi:hypothetical protein GCM10027299_43320 [Larkinella ripae]
MSTENISRDWVKMIDLATPEHSSYCSTRFTSLGLSARQLMEELSNGPIIRDGCIYEPILEGQLPAFVERPTDRFIMQEFLQVTGMTGTGRRFEETVFKEPYEYLGFERVMAFSPDHYVYRRNGYSYASLGRTFLTAGIKVNPAFLGLLMDIDNDPERDMIWFITSTQRGINRSFDILYDVSYRDYLLELGRQYQQAFINKEDQREFIESLIPPVFLEPNQPPSTDPYDVLYEFYFGDVRFDAAISSGADDNQKTIAIFADEIDYAFRKWLVSPKTNLHRVYYKGQTLVECAGEQAPQLLAEIFGSLKKQLLEGEYYEHLVRFEKGLAKVKHRMKIDFELP